MREEGPGQQREDAKEEERQEAAANNHTQQGRQQCREEKRGETLGTLQTGMEAIALVLTLQFGLANTLLCHYLPQHRHAGVELHLYVSVCILFFMYRLPGM